MESRRPSVVENDRVECEGASEYSCEVKCCTTSRMCCFVTRHRNQKYDPPINVSAKSVMSLHDDGFSLNGIVSTIPWKSGTAEVSLRTISTGEGSLQHSDSLGESSEGPIKPPTHTYFPPIHLCIFHTHWRPIPCIQNIGISSNFRHTIGENGQITVEMAEHL